MLPRRLVGKKYIFFLPMLPRRLVGKKYIFFQPIAFGA
jgi:hypothetical protein